MGSSPISGKCFPARFLPFCLPRFVLCFPPSVLPAALSLPAAPFTFSGSHCPLLTYISSCHTRPARLIFPIFLVRPPEFCLSPDREHRLRQAAQRFSPCSIPSPRSVCSLSSSLLSRALLLSSRLLSLIICLLLSLPLLISFFSAPPPLLLSSSAPPGVYQCECLARRSAKLAFPHV